MHRNSLEDADRHLLTGGHAGYIETKMPWRNVLNSCPVDSFFFSCHFPLSVGLAWLGLYYFLGGKFQFKKKKKNACCF